VIDNYTKLLFIGNHRLGDSILSTGIYNYFAQNYSNLQATVVCGSVAEPIFSAAPFTKEVITLRKKKFGLHWLKIWSLTKDIKWNIIVDLRNSLVSRVLSKENYFLYNQDYKNSHRVIYLSSTINKEQSPLDPIIWITPEAEKKAQDVLSKIYNKQKIIAFAPVTNWKRKEWPIHNFIDLARMLINKNSPMNNAKILLLGGPGERERVKEIVFALGKENILNLTAELDILSVAAILKKCNIFIGNDSGLMHLSAAVGIPTIGLFGPSKDELYAPWGKNAKVIRTKESYKELVEHKNYNKNEETSLINSIDPQKVYTACISLLKNL